MLLLFDEGQVGGGYGAVILAEGNNQEGREYLFLGIRNSGRIVEECSKRSGAGRGCSLSRSVCGYAFVGTIVLGRGI